jgi:hypothetical protein
LYHKIPAEVKPSQPTTKVTFVGAFEPEFALLLREIRSTTLAGMQDDSTEIDSNMMALRKLKSKVETGSKENRCFKEQARPSGSGRSVEDKIDEMDKIIKELSNTISKMELNQTKFDQFNRRDFKRNPNP